MLRKTTIESPLDLRPLLLTGAALTLVAVSGGAVGCGSKGGDAPRVSLSSKTAESLAASPLAAGYSVAPDAVAAAGGTAVTVNGAGFASGVSQVFVGNVQASGVEVLSATQLTFVAPPYSDPAGSTSAQSVQVWNGASGVEVGKLYYYPSTNPLIDALTGDVGVTTTAAGTVSNWADQSGHGFTMAQSNPSAQPGVEANYNGSGRSAVAFNGVWTQTGGAGQFMTSTFSSKTAQPVTIYLTGDVVGSSPITTFTPTFYGDPQGNRGPALYYKFGNTVIDAGQEAWMTPTPTGTHISAVVFNGAQSSYWVDGVQLASGQNVSTASMTGLMLGAYQNSTQTFNFLNGHIAEVRIVGGVDSPADIATTTAIMAGRWGIPVGNGACASVCSGTCTAAGRCLTTLASGQAEPFGIALDSNFVYWTNYYDGTVMKVPVGGGTPTAVETGQGHPEGLAVDATNVYWTSATNVLGAPLGGGTVTTLASAQDGPWAVTSNGASLFWANEGTYAGGFKDGTLASLVLGSGGSPTTLTSAQYAPAAVAVDQNNVYWVDAGSGAILRLPLAGSAAGPTTLASGALVGTPRAIAVDGTNVYWTNYKSAGAVSKVPIGGGAVTTIAANQSYPYGIATDGANVFWTNSGNGTVMAAPIGGGLARILASGQATPEAIAVDGESVYWVTHGSSTSNGAVVKTPKN